MASEADHTRNHLLGVLALRMEFVTRDAMRRALKIWEADRTRPLGTILLEAGSLHPSRASLLETLVDEHLQVHGPGSRSPDETVTELNSKTNIDLQSTLEQLLSEAPAAPVAEANVADIGNMATIADPELAEPVVEDDPFATVTEASARKALGNAKTMANQVDPSSTHSKAGTSAELSPGSLHPAPVAEPISAFHAGATPLRYSIVKHHAKGGLGDVYIARDKELAREVALKEIQERYADRNDSRQRFIFEAEITGRLEHPGIVPVYGLGAYADGRPYYAMKFISGETLRDAIDRFHLADENGGRNPGEREVALRELLGRFIDVCNAIGYAHSRGILHRDIKPGNVMVGKFGETLVVDWGLAKAIDRPDIAVSGETEDAPLKPSSGGGSTPTLAGSAIGTPQFMSPEQAAGRLNEMGPAADIYSLGATLYALLSGESPFSEHSTIVVLEKVKKGEFKPPREINPLVPPALNAICLKAMSLASADRYGSTRELVVDVEHWLADEPVSVYQEPLSKRVQRWAKRHKQAVVGGAAVALTLFVSLIVSNRLIAQERDRTIIAKREADTHYTQARTAVETMLDEVGAIDLADVPLMEPVRRRMLQSAAEFYQEFLKTRSQDPALQFDILRSHGRLGEVQELLGDYKASEASYQAAITAYNQLDDTQKADPVFQRALASAELGLGIVQKKSNRFVEAESSLRKAIETREKIVSSTNSPNDRREAALNLYHLGAILARQKTRSDANEKTYRAALDEQRALLNLLRGQKNSDLRRDLARNLNNLGILLRIEDPKAALAAFNEAYDLQTALEKESPTSPSYVWQAARTASNIGGLLSLMGENNLEKAGDFLNRARSRFQKLVADFPKIPDYRQELAATENNLSQLALDDFYGEDPGKKPEMLEAHFLLAKQLIDHAVELRETLVRDFPTRPDYTQALAIALRQRAEILRLEAQQKSEAERAAVLDTAATIITRSIDLQASLLKQFPTARDYDLELARSHDEAGQIAVLASLSQASGNRLADAAEHFQQAVDLIKVSLASNPKSKSMRRQLGEVVQNLAFVHLDRKELAKAVDAIEVAVTSLADDPSELERAAAAYAKAVEIAQNGAPSDGKTTADSLAARSVSLLEQANKAGTISPAELAKPVYVPLKDRADFKRVKQAIEARAKQPVG